ncbi:MAG: hypothetical protein HYT35_00885 [Candidatus Staskawiczbacteria bacterium]|nr:hypothetical protein [Candidatus Staskawiczbacteria bacterium]
MNEIATSLLTIAIMIYGGLVVVGGLVAKNPFEFAWRPYRLLLQTIGRTIRGFCRRFPKTAIVLSLAIAFIALAHHAGYF